MSWRNQKVETVYSLLDETNEVSCIGLMIVGADIPKRKRWNEKFKEFYKQSLSAIFGNVLNINMTDNDENTLKVFKVRKETVPAYIDDLMTDRMYPLNTEFIANVEFEDGRRSRFLTLVFSSFYTMGVDGGRLMEVLHSIADEGLRRIYDSQHMNEQLCEHDEDEEDD